MSSKPPNQIDHNPNPNPNPNFDPKHLEYFCEYFVCLDFCK